MENFTKSAQSFTKNPLGIIGLFIVLVYGFATLALVASDVIKSDLLAFRALVGFLIVMPFTVLAVFFRLATKHPSVFYGPGDYSDDSAYVEILRIVLSGDKSNGYPAHDAKEKADRISRLRNALPGALHGEVLWVDDHPEHNRIIANAFEQLGFPVTIATSTEEALKILEKQIFTSIISDMGRGDDPRAGYTLLDRVREKAISTSFYVYAGSSSLEHDRETRRAGGNGNTNSSSQLIEWIIADAVGRSIWGTAI